MSKWVPLPRLTREDVRDLQRAAGGIDAAAVVLLQSTWSGKVAVLTLLDQVKAVVAGLYNRAEPAFMANPNPKTVRAPQGSPKDSASSESSSEPLKTAQTEAEA